MTQIKQISGLQTSLDSKGVKAVIDATIPFPTAIKADVNSAFTDVFAMVGSLALTTDETGAVEFYGETRHITGDGNDITISGNVNGETGDTISTIVGRRVLLYSMWDGVTMTVKDANSAASEAEQTAPKITSMSVEAGETNKIVVNYSVNVSGKSAGFSPRVAAATRNITSITGT